MTMVERPFDLFRIGGGLLFSFSNWLFFRLWTLFGLLTAVYGAFLLIVSQFIWISYPDPLSTHITRFEIPFFIIYCLGLLIGGVLISWLNEQSGDRPITRTHRYVYQSITTLVVVYLLGRFWEMHLVLMMRIIG